MEVIVTNDWYLLKEKSLVVFNVADRKTVAYGTEAEHLMEEHTEDLQVVSPLRQERISIKRIMELLQKL